MIASQILAGVFEIDGAPAQEAYLRGRLATAQRELRETALDISASFVDPRDALLDPETGQYWRAIGTGTENEAVGGITTEQGLTEARDTCRALAVDNEFAINGHTNRVNYIVGSGHKYTTAARERQKPSDELLAQVQDEVESFLKANKWHRRQQEIQRRKDRDGECFLRLFIQADGMLLVRFVEPGQIKQPEGNQTDTWGISTVEGDVESPTGYWIDGEWLEAGQIQHRKRGVDLNVKRGRPLFYPVRSNLRRAEKLLRNMSVVAEIQTAIALIRKHPGAAQAAVQSFVQNQAAATVSNQTTGTTHYFQRYPSGTILDANVGTEYEFPASGIDASRYVMVLQAELRAVASRLVMPEFMLSSDASNANYSSTLVAEGPAVKQFSRLQWDMIEEDLEIIERALSLAVGAGRLPAEALTQVEVIAEPPRLSVRERDKETTADIALVQAKVMSKATAAKRQDLDWEFEKDQIDEETEENMANADRMFGMQDRMPFGRDNGQDGQGGQDSNGGQQDE